MVSRKITLPVTLLMYVKTIICRKKDSQKTLYYCIFALISLLAVLPEHHV